MPTACQAGGSCSCSSRGWCRHCRRNCRRQRNDAPSEHRQTGRRMKSIIVAAVVVAWSLTCLFTVDQAEYAYVTQFGRPVAVLDGAMDAGLHAKLPWPVQAVQRLDRRVQLFDLPPAELLTHDPHGRTVDRTLTVEAYVCWRIAGPDGADRFLRTVGTPEQARAVQIGRA